MPAALRAPTRRVLPITLRLPPSDDTQKQCPSTHPAQSSGCVAVWQRLQQRAGLEAARYRLVNRNGVCFVTDRVT
jgi:hypothetical protein